ncbi:MAG: radical SAM protein, partial [Deltaproteobacteria bacterium]|nr:radical SAM protein [Deltaproteobacteria bacterium]
MSNMDLLKRSDRESSLPSNMYPQLGKDVSLHISPGYGLVLYGQPPKPLHVSRDTVNILAGCNGMQTVGEILTDYVNAENRGNDVDVSEAILTLTGLINERIVVLGENPKKVKVRITGSHTIFYPTSIQVELTTNCNLSCSYCYRNSGAHEPGRLGTSKLLEILRVLSDNGLHSVELTGGEPLLHPDFIKIMRFCGERFSIGGLLTNGTLITESLIRELLLFKEKMVISVSLDSHISDVHDERRGLRGAFDKTTHGIRLLTQNGFFTRVSMSVDQDNWKDVEATLLLAHQLGASM